MTKKMLLITVVLIGLMVSCSTQSSNEQEPILVNVNGSLRDLTIDDLIKEADLIVVGNVDTVLPSKWKAPNGEVPKNLTLREIFDADLSIFTDTLISIDEILKGKSEGKLVRVRTFIGQIDQVSFVSSSEPKYENGRSYLLFLYKDTGPTQIVDPGDYIAVNAIDGVYEIMDGRAKSIDDEWSLEELITHIQNALLNSQ